jgi:hypothetical protein
MFVLGSESDNRMSRAKVCRPLLLTVGAYSNCEKTETALETFNNTLNYAVVKCLLRRNKVGSTLISSFTEKSLGLKYSFFISSLARRT